MLHFKTAFVMLTGLRPPTEALILPGATVPVSDPAPWSVLCLIHDLRASLLLRLVASAGLYVGGFLRDTTSIPGEGDLTSRVWMRL